MKYSAIIQDQLYQVEQAEQDKHVYYESYM